MIIDIIRTKETLYEEIKKDLNIFRMNRDELSTNMARVLLGEIQRDPKKDYSDENIIKIMRSIRKIQAKQKQPDYALISLIETYLPLPLSSVEIIKWLDDNGYDKAEILKLKNPMQLIGMITKAFSDREVYGDLVKDILDNILQ